MRPINPNAKRIKPEYDDFDHLRAHMSQASDEVMSICMNKHLLKGATMKELLSLANEDNQRIGTNEFTNEKRIKGHFKFLRDRGWIVEENDYNVFRVVGYRGKFDKDVRIEHKKQTGQNQNSFAASETTPKASDIDEPKSKKRVLTEIYRILRDTVLARKIKIENNYSCQICDHKIQLSNEKPYAEAHHIKPLGGEHDGPDEVDNILCVCPNCHVLLDYGAIKLDPELFPNINPEHIEYHNQKIYQAS